MIYRQAKFSGCRYGFLVALAVLTAGCQAAPRIAIFSELDFPYYMAEATDSPRTFRELFTDMGFEVDLLSAKQLADPQVFNAQTHAVYVHP